MKRDRTQLLLHEPSLYKAFIILALPIFAANFMHAFNDLIDTYFIGQIADSVAAQAGISVAWPVLNVLMSLQIGFSVAGVAVISQLLGSAQKERARENAGLLLFLAIIMGAAVNLIIYFCSPAILRLMGAEGGTFTNALDYLRIRSFEMIPLFVFGAFQATRQAQGDTVTPVYLSIITIIINVVFTGVFVRVFEMGAFGAGLATMLGQVAVTPPALIILFSKKQDFHLERKHLRLQAEPLKVLTKIAAPASATQALTALGFLVLQSIILGHGDEVAAAFSNGNKVSNMLLMPVMALGSVLAAYVGQNIGAGNSDRARKAVKVSRNIGLVVSIGGFFLLMPIRGYVVALLTNDALTQELAREYVFWVLLTQPLMALFQNYISTFNGSGNTRYAFIMGTVRLWVIRLPLLLVMGKFTDLGPSGIWYAMVISNFVILLVGMYLYRKVDFAPYRGLTAEKGT